MRVPKRFKMHEVGFVQMAGDKLIAQDHASAVVVPLVGLDDRTGADLPRSEGEYLVATISPKAFQVATQGSKGEGRIMLVAGGTEANAADGKPWVRHASPDVPDVGWQESLERIFHEVYLPPKAGLQAIEVCLDPEALVRVSRAIGAGEQGVRLKFHAALDTGHCDTSRGFIEVRPLREPIGGGYGVLMAVAVGT